ncbi:hypothetical protein OESDEN_08298 [Oesophagostomum dentatum]|uniref:Uncharacterized protein n=1 Tax=Oesophagostomum dentatum TaxID=61180 RepID=A0A0B1T6R1_OESDE|nr:hypothetical protein OESDEN_08298 [Oesophagostomum dentatum]
MSRHNAGHVAIKSPEQLRQDLPGFEMIFSVITLVLASVMAVPDCYLPFLSATTSCKSASDCNGAPCVYSLNRMQRVCCEPKEGAVQPGQFCSNSKLETF